MCVETVVGPLHCGADNNNNRSRTTIGLQTPHKNTDPAVEKSHHTASQHKRTQNKLEELKLLFHDTHTDIITIQETKLTPKVKTPKVHNFTTVRYDRLHEAGGGLITLIRDNITFTTTDIPLTINTLAH